MKSFYKLLFYVTFLVIGSVMISGCGETPRPANAKPAWILNPNQNGHIGAVGVAGRGYDMRVSTQRKLAIQRALDELALQQGVKVKLSMQKEEHLRGNKATVAMDSTGTYQTTNNGAISAHIEDVWEDKISGEIYIWLVLDK